MWRSYAATLVSLTFPLLLLACGTESVDGETLYSQPIEGGNTFACQTCHALQEPAADGLRRPGHAIGDATRRATYKNGQFDDMLDAVNTCLDEWMTAPTWQEGDEEWIALRDFLDAQAEKANVQEAPAITIDVVTPPAALAGGDAAAGQTLFNNSCVVCHGNGATGTDKAPPLLGSLLEPDYIAERIRTSGLTDSAIYDGLTGGRMPFWASDRLSDQELLDVVAFVDQNDPNVEPPTSGTGGPPARVCGSTHPLVGQTATLSTRSHGVSGTARVVDDCTIEIDDFVYDGNGIDVRVYGGRGGDYDAGFAMSGDLLRRGGYEGETVQANLPEGLTLDDLDGVSIWCVAVGTSFGDGTFGQ